MRLCVALAALLTLALAVPAFAAEPPVTPAAKQLVDLAVEHYQAGRYSEASSEFEEAYRLSPRAGLLFNIARAEGKLGHHQRAIEFLRKYLEKRPDAPDVAAVMAEIEAHQQALASVEARQKAEADAAESRLRAEAMARQETRREEERLREEERAREDARLRENTRKREDDRLRADVLSAAQRDESIRAMRRAGIALLVAGPLLAIVGIALGVVAEQAASTVTMGRGDFATCCGMAERRGQGSQAAGIALDVIGGAAAVTGAVLLGWSYRGAAHRERAWIFPTGLGLAAGARF